MTRAEASRQLFEIRLGVISYKKSLKKLVETPGWETINAKNKVNTDEVFQNFSVVINQLTNLEKSMSFRLFRK